MKRLGLCLALALAVSAATLRPAFAQDAAAAAATPTAEQKVLLAQLKDAEEKVVELASATPPAKMAWRPGKGVRSTAEVFLHLAQANYFLPTMVGVAPPAGIVMKGYEQSTTDKARIVQELRNSYDHARKALTNATPADFDRSVVIFDHDGTGREALVILVTHSHEHLGQSIAYARMNGVVPPWTARELAAQAATKKDKDKK